MKFIMLDCKCHKISRDGNVYSCLNQFSKKGKQGIQTKKTRAWRKLKPILNRSGYYQIVLHGKIWRINRLIAKYFLANKMNYPEVHHINGVRTDNRVVNLKWGNQKQNAFDRRKHGNQAYGSKSPMAKLNESEVIEIRKLLEMNTLQKIADKYSVSKKLILLIKQGKIWKHI